jgi:hypothetical protein
MQRRRPISGFRGPRPILRAVGAFAVVDAAGLAGIDAIRHSGIGFSWTGFFGGKAQLVWGYDAIWFPVFLLVTAVSFAWPAWSLGLLRGPRLYWCILLVSFVRLTAAYTWWLSFALIVPLLQRYGPALGYWPPGGTPRLLTVWFFEVALVAISMLAFANGRRSVTAPDAEGAGSGL